MCAVLRERDPVLIRSPISSSTVSQKEQKTSQNQQKSTKILPRSEFHRILPDFIESFPELTPFYRRPPSSHLFKFVHLSGEFRSVRSNSSFSKFSGSPTTAFESNTVLKFDTQVRHSRPTFESDIRVQHSLDIRGLIWIHTFFVLRFFSTWSPREPASESLPNSPGSSNPFTAFSVRTDLSIRFDFQIFEINSCATLHRAPSPKHPVRSRNLNSRQQVIHQLTPVIL